MSDPNTNRSWTIAAASATAGAAMLTLGLFLAVGKDSLADPAAAPAKDDGEEQVVRIVSVSGDDAEAVAAFEADVEGRGGKGGYLGVSLREDTKSNEGGALVTNVVDDSPAAKAGVKDGDVIVAFGGDVVRGPAKVTEKLRASKPGDKVMLEVRRDGKTQKFNFELGERPSMSWHFRSGENAPLNKEGLLDLERSLKSLEGLDDDRISKMKIYAPGTHGMRMRMFGPNRPLLGIEMIETTPELREAMGGSKDAGVLVGKVLSGGAAEKGGLRVGDLILSIDGKKVSDPGALAIEIGSHEGKTVDVEIVRDRKPMRIKAVLPKFDEPEDEPTGPRASALRLWGAASCAAAAIRRLV